MKKNNIFIYWHQGWDNAPIVSKKCAESWLINQEEYDILMLDKDTINNYINLDYLEIPKNITLASLSDIIRISLLNQYGGIWVDSTLYCNKKLKDWLIEDSFFAFSYPTPDRMVSSWFLSAQKNNYIVKKWHDEMVNHWVTVKNCNDYFWFHRLFNKCYDSDIKFKSDWDSVTNKISADVNQTKGPHRFTPYNIEFPKKINSDIVKDIMMDDSPVFKLNWTFDVLNDTILDYILNTHNKTNETN